MSEKQIDSNPFIPAEPSRNITREAQNSAQKNERKITAPSRQSNDWRSERTGQIDHKVANKIARDQAEAEARRRYHEAWQKYYQQYYEHYYLTQLEAQKRQIIEANNASNVIENSERQEVIDGLRKNLIDKINRNAKKATRSKHFKPILAGIAVILFFIFIQYNQFFAASWRSLISPGSENSSSIVIANNDNLASNQEPTIIIPKINVKAPVQFNLSDLSDSGTMAALNDGVIAFPVAGADSKPGQNGNTVLVGHSSSDLFNSGSYKFIFVQLNKLNPGDLFYIDYDGTRYTYEVTDKKVIAEDDLAALNLGNKAPYATLVTCDPPGTNWNRLIVIGKQISPDPNSATKNNDVTTNSENESLPGVSPSLFDLLF